MIQTEIIILNLILFVIIWNTFTSFFIKKRLVYCGLIGYSGRSASNPDKLALLMYMNSVERGKDATGYYTPDTGVLKDSESADNFLKKNQLPSSRTFIGHVRKSSSGYKIKSNAHPFEFDNIVGVHNGTLVNHNDLIEEAGLNKKDFDVDSQMLYKLLDLDYKAGGEKPFKTLSKFDGAAALIFSLKDNPNKIYVYKNYDRPLYRGKIGTSMYISSIDDSLKIIGCEQITLFTSLVLYEIDKGVIVNETQYPAFTKISKQAIVYKGQNCCSTDDERYSDWMNTRSGASTSAIKPSVSYTNATKSTPEGQKQFEALITELQTTSVTNTSEMVGRWFRAKGDFNKYGSEDIVLKKGKFYYIDENFVENDYDIHTTDETGKLVRGTKYMFDMIGSIIKDYTVFTQDVYSNKGDKDLLYYEGEIAEVIDPKIEKIGEKCIEIRHEKDDRSYKIPIEYLRAATPEEIKLEVDKKKLKLDKEEYAISMQNEADIDTPPFDIDDTSDNKVADFTKNKPVNEFEEYISRKIYDTVIEIIGDKVEEVDNAIKDNDHIKIDKTMDELKEMIIQADEPLN